MGKEGWGSVVRAGRFLTALLVLAALGCSTPKVIPSYECIIHYDRMADRYEPLVSLVYPAEPVDLSRYRAVIVGPVTLGRSWVKSRADAERYATFYRVSLLKALSALNVFDDVRFGEAEPAGAPPTATLRIDTMITRFDMGSGILRYASFFLFFLQGSATDFQIEGRITDAGTGQTLVEFVDRRRHLGNTPWGPSPRNFKRNFAMTVTAHETAQAFAAFVGMTHGQEGKEGSLVASQASRRVAVEDTR